jgi:hypothetical protein
VAAPKKYPDELRQRAVRLYRESGPRPGPDGIHKSADRYSEPGRDRHNLAHQGWNGLVEGMTASSPAARCCYVPAGSSPSPLGRYAAPGNWSNPHAAGQVAALLRACRPGKPLPDPDTVTRRLRASASVVPTFGAYLHRWVAGRGHLSANTLRCYHDHIRLYLEPHLGHIPLDELTVAHFETMYAAIAERDTRIRHARASGDPTVRASVKGRRTMGAASRQRLRATAR